MEPHTGSRLSVLDRLTDDTGLFEHAWHSLPRRAHGYCSDDNGRGLALVSRIGGSDAPRLARIYLAFLCHAHVGGGVFRLRLAYDRRFTDHGPSDDANGRAILGIGTAAAVGPGADVRSDARALFDEVQHWRSPSWRATAAAGLGAAEVVEADPGHVGALRMVADACAALPRPCLDPAWPWPEDRLAYENGRLPQALIRFGDLLGDQRAVADGLRLLHWLIDVESGPHGFSFTPVGGRGIGEQGPAFDQQPIEAWAMAEACLAAMRVAPDDRFARSLELAAGWFDGANDAGVAMIDPVTGGGFDGLAPTGVNRNQGAESQLAVLGAQQAVHDYRRAFQAV